MTIEVLSSCGDCAFLTNDSDEFDAHGEREWHKLVLDVGLFKALETPILPDAQRAVDMKKRLFG